MSGAEQGGGEDYRWVLDVHAPHMACWRQRIEVDRDGWWWLVDGTRRRGRRRSTWRPADEQDACAVVVLLHTLNDVKMTLSPEVRRWAKDHHVTDEAVRTSFSIRAYSLFVRYLLM